MFIGFLDVADDPRAGEGPAAIGTTSAADNRANNVESAAKRAG
jgi:hypothetical protein